MFLPSLTNPQVNKVVLTIFNGEQFVLVLTHAHINRVRRVLEMLERHQRRPHLNFQLVVGRQLDAIVEGFSGGKNDLGDAAVLVVLVLESGTSLRTQS